MTWARTAFFAGVTLGTGGTVGFSGVASAAGACWGVGEDENLDEIFENHEPFRWDGDPPLTATIFSNELLLPTTGRDTGIGFAMFAASALPLVLAVVSEAAFRAGCGDSPACCEETVELGDLAVLLALSGLQSAKSDQILPCHQKPRDEGTSPASSQAAGSAPPLILGIRQLTLGRPVRHPANVYAVNMLHI